MAWPMESRSFRGSTAGIVAVAVVVSCAGVTPFFCGIASSAAVLSLPPVQPIDSSIAASVTPTTPVRILMTRLIHASNSNGCAVSSIVRRCRYRLALMPESFERRFAAITADQMLIVFIGNAGHAVERCDELFAAQTPPQERVGVEDVVAEHAECAEGDFGIEAEKLLHQFE